MGTLTSPYTFTAGTPAVASQVNADLTTLYNWVNANAMWSDGSVAFTGVPSGPNTDPTSANQLTRKSYVDNFAQYAGQIANRPIQIRAAQETPTTDASGGFTVTYRSPFSNNAIAVVPVIGTSGQGQTAIQFTNTTATAFTGRAINSSTGAGIANTAVPVTYLALGY